MGLSPKFFPTPITLVTVGRVAYRHDIEANAAAVQQGFQPHAFEHRMSGPKDGAGLEVAGNLRNMFRG